jgi:hypothetical protein
MIDISRLIIYHIEENLDYYFRRGYASSFIVFCSKKGFLWQKRISN